MTVQKFGKEDCPPLENVREYVRERVRCLFMVQTTMEQNDAIMEKPMNVAATASPVPKSTVHVNK